MDEPTTSVGARAGTVAPESPSRGRLKVYLGATPGAGKTFAMLREARQRKQRGEDVAIAYVETYGRARTEELLSGLELIPRTRVPYRGTVLEELDLDAPIRRPHRT